MKRKQKSCQNEPSAGRFDGLLARFDGVKTKPQEYHFNLMFGLKSNAMRCLCPAPKGKSNSQSGWRTVQTNLGFLFQDLNQKLKFFTTMSTDPQLHFYQ
jgi:hypothetical protein